MELILKTWSRGGGAVFILVFSDSLDCLSQRCTETKGSQHLVRGRGGGKASVKASKVLIDAELGIIQITNGD